MSKLRQLTILLVATTLILGGSRCYGQEIGRVSKGSLGIGFHVACPQSELQDIEYDEGVGLHLSYLSRRYPYKSKINYQLGVQLDFANMRSKQFSDIELEDPNIIGDATIDVTNKMYGGFLLGRINYGTERDKITPYVNLLIGHRNYNTSQLLSLDEPSQNPDYQTDTFTNKVVFTKRFHYGVGAGINYRLNRSLSVEAGATYTIGETGAVLPLKNITRPSEENEIDYTQHRSVRTDMLLIHVNLRLHLYKTYRYRPYIDEVGNPLPELRNTRYTDNQNRSDTTESEINDSKNDPNTPTKKKSPIKIKPNGPKKDPNDKS